MTPRLDTFDLATLAPGVYAASETATIEVVVLGAGEHHELGTCHVDRWIVISAGAGTLRLDQPLRRVSAGQVHLLPADTVVRLEATDGRLRAAVLATTTALVASAVDGEPVDDWSAYD
jgi:quercetin dioxygenase-like cupin family protein